MNNEVQTMRANIFQIAAHEAVGQKRKFSGLPYYTHPQAVAHILQVHVSEATTDMIVATYLHDTVEDTKVTFDTINFYFGSAVEAIVRGLTNVKVKGMNRAAQKRHDAARIAAESWAVKVIKLCDRLHNLPDIIAHDPAHACVYVPETRYLLDTALVGVHDVLWNKLDVIIKQYYESNPDKLVLDCPSCSTQHIDEGVWAVKPHKTHQCQSCLHEWRPFNHATVGVTK